MFAYLAPPPSIPHPAPSPQPSQSQSHDPQMAPAPRRRITTVWAPHVARSFALPHGFMAPPPASRHHHIARILKNGGLNGNFGTHPARIPSREVPPLARRPCPPPPPAGLGAVIAGAAEPPGAKRRLAGAPLAEAPWAGSSAGNAPSSTPVPMGSTQTRCCRATRSKTLGISRREEDF